MIVHLNSPITHPAATFTFVKVHLYILTSQNTSEVFSSAGNNVIFLSIENTYTNIAIRLNYRTIISFDIINFFRHQSTNIFFINIVN